MSDTATVETLVAEVRVLMVGKRQVTLSVAKQLDSVPLSQLTVFGRVKLGSEDDYVIGADKDGRLALARYSPRGYVRTPWIVEEDLGGGRVKVCRAWIASDGAVERLKFSGAAVSFSAGAIEPCEFDEHTKWSSERCPHWYANGLDAHIQRIVDAHAAEVARHLAAADAPLIVLAGLR